MSSINRRTFLQLSSTAVLATASGALQAESASQLVSAPAVTADGSTLRVQTADYTWSYTGTNDQFQLRDAKQRLIVSGPVQPAVLVADQQGRRCSLGKAARPQITHGRVGLTYDDVNGGSSLSLNWRFGQHGLWIDPVTYRPAAGENVVSLHYFAKASRGKAVPALDCTFLVIPGINEGPVISPVLNNGEHLSQTLWLGRGGPRGGPSQQWALPAHFFSGFSVNDVGAGSRYKWTKGKSDTFTCGLADLPNGDFLIDLRGGKSSPWMDYRSDLWKFLHGPDPIQLGATLYWSIGSDDYDAIGRYYEGLIQSHTIQRKDDSMRKAALALRPQFCTWGAQVSRGKTGDHLDEAFLTEIYDELRHSGMKAELFSIDDKWEGSYGSLEHSTERLPHFEQFLDRARADGLGIGMWAALMRCEKPSDLGLTEDNMLKRVDGSPYKAGGGAYYLLDCTQPKVADALAGACRRFIRRYKPDLFKFDFGYEIPPMGVVAPADREWAGEKLLWKGMDVAIGAMKQENPDLVVMYYQLSPLFMDYFDLHSPDDLFFATGDYDIEANRRYYFSGLLGRLGLPTYGSSGYDWASLPNIWLDSAPVGTIGSLNDFQADERGEGATPELIARYNGVRQALRPSNRFLIEPIGTVQGASVRGARARSWVRTEAGKPVLAAFRPPQAGNNLSGSSSRYEDLVEANFPVLVASRTNDALGASRMLAVVPYADGAISILHNGAGSIRAVSHYFGGASETSSASIAAGRIRLEARTKNGAGAPLEWIEVRISRG